MVCAAIALAATNHSNPDEAVQAMIRRVITAPEATSRIVIERSDPFGGSSVRERGQLWYLPGHGLRYKSAQSGGQDVSIDRDQGTFLVYSPSENVVYRAPFSRAPSPLRRLITEPERVFDRSLEAVLERRTIKGVARTGYRLRPTALGDSLPDVSVWIAGDPNGGLPRWIAIASDAESVLVEFEGLTLRRESRTRDLALGAPKNTPEEPLDPRELLERSEKGESH